MKTRGILAVAGMLAVMQLSGCSTLKKMGHWVSDALTPDKETATHVSPEKAGKVSSVAGVQLKAVKQWVLPYYVSLNSAELKGLALAEGPDTFYVGMPDGVVTAFRKTAENEATNQVLWEVKLDSPITGGPVLGQHLLYVGTAEGELVALDPKTGHEKWVRQLSSSIDALPVLSSGGLFVRTLDGHLYALKPDTGATIWQVTHLAPGLALQGEPPVLVAGDGVFVAWENGQLEALHLKNGQLAWRQQIALPRGRTDLERMVDIQATPHLFAARPFVASFRGKLAALDPASGRPYWVKDFSTYRDILLSEGRLYAVDDEDVLHAFDLITGTPLWKNDHLKHQQLTDLRLWRKAIVVGDRQGRIHFIEPVNGVEVGTLQHAVAPVAQLFVVDGGLVVVDGEGDVTRYRVDIQP